jgi:hypothetical protein
MPTSVVGQAEHLNESVGSQQNSVATTGPLSKEKKVDSNDSAKRAEDKNLLHRGSRVAGKKKHKKEREQNTARKITVMTKEHEAIVFGLIDITGVTSFYKRSAHVTFIIAKAFRFG